MQAILISEVMGALPNNEEPDKVSKSDIVAYVIFLLLIAFAWVASKYL
jgi:hypothetical protein